jgi:hypothetical protein
MGELREAFCEAVKLYCENDWSPAVPELPEVTIGKEHCSIRAVFEFATELGDALPDDNLFRDLDYCMRGLENRDLRKRLGKDQTYATAASCMLELLNRRERKYQQQESGPNR